MDTRSAQAIIGAEKKQKKKCGRIPNLSTQSQKKTAHTLFGSHDREEEKMYWNARAEYEDGSSIERNFDYNDRESDNDQQYDIECWLIERKPGCTWYSVGIVYDE